MPTYTTTLRYTGLDRRVEGIRGNGRYQTAILKDGRAVPADVAALTVGRDGWMRSILFKCSTCGLLRSAEHLFVESDVPGDCADCAEEFWCAVCGGHPEDCNRCQD